MTTRLHLSTEWERSDARLPLLKRSWARISIGVDGVPITRLIDTETGGFRDAVYGAAWPLAAWLVTNWWTLFNEGQRTTNASIREAHAEDLRWFHRHNLISAQEASALPDLSIFRDGERVVLRWHADAATRPERGIRFIESGMAVVTPAEWTEAVARFVEATLHQCSAQAHDPECQAVREDWVQTRKLTGVDLLVAERAARLGLDPFDADDLTPDIDTTLRELRLRPKLADDLLEIAAPDDLRRAVPEVEAALTQVMPNGARGRAHSFASPAKQAGLPFRAGYDRARKTRADLGIGNAPRLDIGQLHVSAAQLDHLDTQGLVGVLGWAGSDYVLGMARRSPRAERFALARAAFLAPPVDAGFDGRLVTDSLSWEQAASRAFAAELLAPAAALRERLGKVADDSTVASLADEFDVAERVIEHQIENHRLAVLAT